MFDIIKSTAVTFLSLFFIIDAIGVTPIFISLTTNTSNEYKKKMIKKGVIISFAILLFFALSGTSLLSLLGIELPAFRIAGGILLLLLAIDMVLAKPSSAIKSENKEEHEEAKHRNDISVFPLAIPLLSGPAAITMLILFMKQAEGSLIHQFSILVALTLNMIVCWVVLNFAVKISKFLGRTGINVLNRIFGILLTALACQFFIDGISEAFLKR